MKKNAVVKMKVMLDKGAFCPVKAHLQDAGYDLYTPVDAYVPAHGSAIIDTGVHMVLQEGWCGLLVSKSGLNVMHELTTTGLIDAGYTGSIRVKVHNHGDRPYSFERGDRVSQIILMPVPDVQMYLVDELPQTERGANGFGSSGR